MSLNSLPDPLFYSLSQISEKVYATLSSGVMTLFTIKKDGKSTKHILGLYGSAIGLVDSNLVHGNKDCFRVLDGFDSIILKADSADSQMEWATAIAHSISLENGGGILLDKEKRAVEQEDGKQLDSSGFPIGTAPTPPIFRGVENDEPVTSIVFSKPIKEINLDPVESGEVIRLEPIQEPLTEKNIIDPRKLNITNATEATVEEVDTTFNSLHPVDLSHSMEDFARQFFVVPDSKPMGSSRLELPVQSLRDDASKEWLTIDRLSSTSGGSEIEIFEKISDFDEEETHINSTDFNTLLQFTKVSAV